MPGQRGATPAAPGSPPCQCISFREDLQWEPVPLASWEVFGMSFEIYVLCRQYVLPRCLQNIM